MKEYMENYPGIIVTNRMQQLFDCYGKEYTLKVLRGEATNVVVARHLNNLILTYPNAFYDVLQIINRGIIYQQPANDRKFQWD